MATRPPTLPEMVERMRRLVENADHVMEFVEGRERKDLDDDTVLQFALMKAVENLGHEAWVLDTRFRPYLPEGIPWKDMADMRHVLAHHYQKVKTDKLWGVATQDVPEGLPEWRRFLEELETIEREEPDGQDQP